MSFVYPAFLFALAAISIPIIIHLFNFRKFKRVYFTNVKFLKEVKQETQSKSQLRHLLVLLSRILAITFLVLAFAQPFIPAEGVKATKGTQAVSVFIDNSFSMDAVSQNGRLLDQARAMAAEIGDAYQPSDQYQVLTHDFEGRHQRLVNQEEFNELVDEVEIGPGVQPLSDIISRQKDALLQSEAESKTLYIISDFQRTITNLDELTHDSTVNIRLVPLAGSDNRNLYIDSVWFKTPIRQLNQPEELTVRIRNIGDEAYESIPMKLNINGQQKGLATFSIEPQGSIDTTLFFTNTETGIQHAVVSITDHPVTFDDKFYLSFEVAEHIPMMSISTSDSNSYVKALFGADEFFILTHANHQSVDYGMLSAQKLVVLTGLNDISSGLAQELTKFMDKGGSVLLFPGEDIKTDSYREFMLSNNGNYFEQLDTNDTEVSLINLEHPIYANVFERIPDNLDLPKVGGHYKLSRNTRSSEEYLLRMQNGLPFLARYSSGNGKLYVCASPLLPEFSNFAQHAVFVPSLYKIAMHSQPSTDLYYTIREDESIELPVGTTFGDKVVHLGKVDGSTDFIPEHRMVNNRLNIILHNQVADAGNYVVTQDAKELAGVAFNYERKESDLQVYNEEELQANYEAAGLLNFGLLDFDNKDVVRVINEIAEGRKLWRICIILCLLFFAFEIILLKFWKT